ncbi:MAG: thiamine phosphate synthase, partial [Candidatus Ornithomonoglobus sp.]
MLNRLYAITDRGLIQRSLGGDIEAAIKGGAGLIQLREKNIPDEKYLEYAEEALAVCRKHNVPLIINDNIDVCLKSGADGVHLGQGDASPADARRILGSGAIIGVTAKTAEQAQKAYSDGADYIGSGAVFGTVTKGDAKKMSIDTLKEITAVSKLPVYAIGGINIDNVSELSGSGVYGIAVVSGIFKGDIEANSQRLKEAVKR